MLRGWILFSAVLLSGCMANDCMRTLAMSENNDWNFCRLYSGMCEPEVIRIMGKPYDYQTIYVAEDIYDIWFYVTKPTGLGQSRMVRQNLTPLTFKNGELVGWGSHFYDHVLKLERVQIQKEETPAIEKKENPEENKEIEKVLTPPHKSEQSQPRLSLTMSTEPKEETDSLQEQKPKEEKPYMDEEDRKAMEEESEQNFDFW